MRKATSKGPGASPSVESDLCSRLWRCASLDHLCDGEATSSSNFQVFEVDQWTVGIILLRLVRDTRSVCADVVLTIVRLRELAPSSEVGVLAPKFTEPRTPYYVSGCSANLRAQAKGLCAR